MAAARDNFDAFSHGRELSEDPQRVALLQIDAACRNDCASLARLLEIQPATRQDASGMTALAWAARNGRAQALGLLLPRSDADWRHPENGDSALMIAAFYGHVECARLLIPACDPLSRNDRGDTALMIAAQSSAACVELLLPVSDPLARNEDGVSALMFACSCAASGIVDLLLPHSDFWAEDPQGINALSRALKAKSEGCLAALLADPAFFAPERTAERAAALRQACFAPNFAWGAKALLASGFCDSNAVDSRTRSPLHLAALTGDPETLQALLRAGADPLARTRDGFLPIDASIFPAVTDLLAPSAPLDALRRAVSRLSDGQGESARILLCAREVEESIREAGCDASPASPRRLPRSL